jgi:hypothetical protein
MLSGGQSPEEAAIQGQQSAPLGGLANMGVHPDGE